MSPKQLQAQLHKVVAQQLQVREIHRSRGRSDPRAQAALEAVAKAEKTLREEIRRELAEASKKANETLPTVPRVQCTECGRRMKVPSVAMKGILAAHQREDKPGAWCPGGRTPTRGERNRALHPLETVQAARPEVRTVSGGLPSLGKRR